MRLQREPQAQNASDCPVAPSVIALPKVSPLSQQRVRILLPQSSSGDKQNRTFTWKKPYCPATNRNGRNSKRNRRLQLVQAISLLWPPSSANMACKSSKKIEPGEHFASRAQPDS